MQLFAGGNLLAQDQYPPIPAVGGFLTSTVNFTANVLNPYLGQTLEIRLLSGGQETIFDNVRLEAVPIPAAAWLFGSGLLGLIGITRCNKT